MVDVLNPARPRRFRLAILLTSILLAVLGFLFLGLTVALSPKDFMKSSRATVYSVYWFGCLTIITAALGLFAGTRQTRCPVGCFMVFSITVTMAAALTILVLVAMYVGYNLPIGIKCADSSKGDCRQGLNITFVIGLVATAIITLGCAVMAAVLACCTICRCCRGEINTRDDSDDVETSPAMPVIPLGYISTPTEDLRVPRLTVPSGMYGSSTEELPLYKPEM